MKVKVMIGIDRFDRGIDVDRGIIDISIVSVPMSIDTYPSIDAYPKLLAKGKRK